ncbi:MAG: hypothetical protein QME61_00100 [Patescibacteria group bacterium]|nr:hypothetical protein [Patescibacteria group bacterium]
MSKNLKLIFIGVVFLAIPLFAHADIQGQQETFNIDSSYDIENRNQLMATLRKITDHLYFYIDDAWWQKLSSSQKEKIDQALTDLGYEFQNKIYPILTSTFGSEWKPGIDNDERITILIHEMIEEAGGYFNSGDEYSKAQNPKSNQREMVYLNAQHLDKPNIKSSLAHEFLHLITFNQKEKKQKVSEEIWLNEARSEYAPTLLGYDQIFEGSNLQMRINNFIDKPYDSLTEWQNLRYDYGVINLFIQYLVDHYGVEILVDSLKSPLIGIPSINEALAKRGFEQDFSQIFTDWTIAVLVNNCSLGPRYCYLNKNLKDFRVIPTTNFLPMLGEGKLSVTYATPNWTGNWHKIIGGKGILELEFDGQDEVNFKVPYVLCLNSEQCSIDFLSLDKEQKGKITISDFGEKYTSLTIIPSLQTKISGFNGFEPSYSFSWQASIKEPEEIAKKRLIENLLARIAELQAEISRLQAQINAILAERGWLISCQKLENNLYYGLVNNADVRCLQEFLRVQGPEIYPEGLVTGNFLSLTQTAVIRFQEKYATEILTPLGLKRGTGYVGPATRAKINELISFWETGS